MHERTEVWGRKLWKIFSPCAATSSKSTGITLTASSSKDLRLNRYQVLTGGCGQSEPKNNLRSVRRRLILYDNLSLLILLLSFFLASGHKQTHFLICLSLPGGGGSRFAQSSLPLRSRYGPSLRNTKLEWTSREKLCFLVTVSKAWLYKVSKNVEMLTNLQANTFYYSMFSRNFENFVRILVYEYSHENPRIPRIPPGSLGSSQDP